MTARTATLEPWLGEIPMRPEAAIRLAIDAILNDSRREPYGHHQHGRDYAVQALRGLLEPSHVRAYHCPGPAAPQTSHWGPHPGCPECGSDLDGAI